jgi:hypothetical protein
MADPVHTAKSGNAQAARICGNLGGTDMARRVMLWAGVPLMVLGGLLGVGGLLGSNNLWQYAVPFWMFVGGLVLALVGASQHERQNTTRRGLSAEVLAGGGANVNATMAATHAPAARTTAASSLSALKRPTASGAALVSPDAIQARLQAIEAENKSLRDYLLAAKVSIAR